MLGSFESVRWNVYVHRPDLGLYSYPIEFIGTGVRTNVNSKGKKYPLPANEPNKFDLQLLSQCGNMYNCLGRSVAEIHKRVTGTSSNQQANKQTPSITSLRVHLHVSTPPISSPSTAPPSHLCFMYDERYILLVQMKSVVLWFSPVESDGFGFSSLSFKKRQYSIRKKHPLGWDIENFLSPLLFHVNKGGKRRRNGPRLSLHRLIL